MRKRLYSLHHQDAHTTCAFYNKGHFKQQFPVISITYKYPIVPKERQ